MPTTLRVTTGGDTPELYIYDEIGPSWLGLIDDVAVLDALNEIGETDKLVVRLNSPGGDVFIGNSIYNALRRFDAEITVEVDSLAASIASVIAMAGDTIRIADNAMLMIHESWTFALGNKRELYEKAKLLAKIDDTIIDTYVNKTRQSRAELEKMMVAETWLTARESVDKGFADAIIGAQEIEASIPDHLNFRNVPKKMAACVYRRQFMRRRGRGFPERDSALYPHLKAVEDRRKALTETRR